MSEENKNLVYKWFERVWNQKREEAIDEMLTDETIHHGLGGAETVEVRGIENFKEFFRVFSTAFPDLQVTIRDVFSDGEKVSARYDATATDDGDGLGIAPTGNNVEFTGMGICIVRDGKFVEVWNKIDFMKLYSQIGATRVQ